MRSLVALSLALAALAGHAWGYDTAQKNADVTIQAAADSAARAHLALATHVAAADPAVAGTAARTAVDDFLNDGWTVGNCRITTDRSIARTDRRNDGVPAPLDRCRVLPNGGLYVADWRDTPTPTPPPTKVP